VNIRYPREKPVLSEESRQVMWLLEEAQPFVCHPLAGVFAVELAMQEDDPSGDHVFATMQAIADMRNHAIREVTRFVQSLPVQLNPEDFHDAQ
jgi:hypothetical protein